MKKRFLVYLLAIVLVFSTAQSALADGATELGQFSEGLAMVKKRVSNGVSKVGFVDTEGNVVIPYQYDDAGSFNNGVAWVSIYEGEGANRHSVGFYIDKTGKTVEVEPRPSLQYSEGLASVENDDGTWSYIDESGKTVLSGLAYAYVYGFQEGFAVVQQKEADEFVDDEGIIHVDFSNVKYGYIDKTGELVIPAVYSSAYGFSEGLAIVRNDDGSGYIDKTGKFVIPAIYSYVGSFSEGLASVKNDDGTWGYIDKSGKTVLSGLAYYWVGYFHDGRAAVVELPGEEDYVGKGDDRYLEEWRLMGGYIDKTGKLVIPTIYRTTDYEQLGDFSEGLARVYHPDDGPLYIDVDGNVIISDLQYEATSFKDGLALSFRNEEVIVLKNPLTSGATTPPVTLPALVAKPTSSTVLVNGKAVAFDAYNINDNNYFKLRDLAFVLTGSEKQFDVAWDAANNAISLASGKPYTPVGGEMEGKGAGTKTPNATTSKITLDGQEVSFTAYNIEGNNYFKLRDVAAALDFGVTWDGAAQRITINTGASYTPE